MLNDKGSIEVPAWMLTIYGAEVEDDGESHFVESGQV